MLWNSSNQKSIMLNFESSECLKNESYGYTNNEILSKNWTNNKLEILVRGEANCCTNKSGNYSIENNNIKLKLKESGSQCFCFCPFDFKYTIYPLEKKDYNISFEIE